MVLHPTIESRDEPFSSPIIDKFSTYVEQRFNQLKIALVQIPAFRKMYLIILITIKKILKMNSKIMIPRLT